MRSLFSVNNKVGQEFVFQTNSSSGVTFDPSVTMSGSKRASWDLGEGDSYFAGNSVSYTYPNSSVKTVKLRTNRLSDITDINMTDDNVVGGINLSKFVNCTSYQFNANTQLTGVTFPTTNTTVNTIRFFFCNLQGNLDLSVMPNFGGTLFISANSNLTGLTIPTSNSNVFSQLSIDACNIYGRIDLSGYTNLGGIINISNNPNITGVTFPVSSQNINTFYIGNNGFTHDLVLTGLTGLGGSILIDNVDSPNIYLPNSSNNITLFNLNACPFITNADLSSLSGLGGSVNLQSNTGVTSYILPSSTNTITSLGINSNTSITSLNLSPLSGMSTTALLSDNTSLNNLILPSVFAGPVTSWDISNCNLPASGVNYVLYIIDNTGWTGGILKLGGAGNSAPDGSSGGYDGTTAKTNLTAKSWTVTTN